jgi:hypothetical protein
MPQLPLIRLLQSHGDLLVEKNGLIQWNHRQLSEEAARRYHAIELDLRKLLARYFIANIDSEIMRDRRLVVQARFVAKESQFSAMS